ncbi:MAG: NADPH-dependent FMN reductase [Vicinamibacterales bacterium]
MPILQVLIASTRPTRVGPRIAEWFVAVAEAHGGFEVEVADLAEIALPLFDEPAHPRLGKYEHAHTRDWSARVARADAFAFVTPEYNYGPAPSLINAISYLSTEWAYKPLGFVSYGGLSGGIRAVQITKSIVTTLRMVPIVEAVALPFVSQHLDKETGAFQPTDANQRAATTMLNELVRWEQALRGLRVSK